MKAILSYENYQSFGKQYQVKFVYENEVEVKKTFKLMMELKKEYLINPCCRQFKKNNIVDKTNIPKDNILSFINALFSLKNIKIIIGNEEFISFEPNEIKKCINKLHLNIILFKGEYFKLKYKYYAIFKYANEEQSNEISYEFFNKLYPISIENTRRIQNNEEYMTPFLIDKNGNLTLQSSRIIGGTNIPDDILKQILSFFVIEHNAILTIGNNIFKDTIDEEILNMALNSIEPGKSRIRKPSIK